MLWFWWFSYSFSFYNVAYLVPFMLLFIAFGYGSIFYLIGIVDNIYYKSIAFFALSFISPFGFNWLKPELIFINSYLDTSKIAFLIIIISIALCIRYKNYYFLLLLIFTINYNKSEILKPNLNIYMPQYNVDQNFKWNKKQQSNIIIDNFKNIDYAIKNNYDLIVLPETAFPLALNKYEKLTSILREKSKKISIISGALEQKNGQMYNSTYFFDNNKTQIANKMVLVPFGEAVPLPKIFRDLINNIIYDGADDYEVALYPTTFNIKGTKFRNAICYEATTNKIYQNLDTPYVIVTSNNAWFTPSIEPTLQNMLLKYYANKYNLFIFHSANSSQNKIIRQGNTW